MYRHATFILLLALAALVNATAQPPAVGNSAESAIRSLLQQQVQAWNRHDLKAFMAGYWNSPELTFFSEGTKTDGWQPTLQRYRRAYQAEGKEMGRLEISDIKVVPLSSEAAYVLGRWQLTMLDGKTPHGLYTLIFRKYPQGWRIIHDHTSAAQ